MKSNQSRGKSSLESVRHRRERRRVRRKATLRNGSRVVRAKQKSGPNWRASDGRPKGLNVVRIENPDGTKATYVYAYKGGPRVYADVDTPEFEAAYLKAVTPPVEMMPGAPGTLGEMIHKYLDSEDFLANLSEVTQREYRRTLKKIEERLGTLPITALADPAIRGVFLDWRDEVAKPTPENGMRGSRSRAHLAFKVLRLLLSWVVDRGKLPYNPCFQVKRIYHGTRIDKIWSLEQEAEFFIKVPARFWIAVILALWTGQREGSLIALRWSDYDGKNLRCKLNKRRVIDPDKWVLVPCGMPLRIALDALKEEANVQPWEESTRTIIEHAFGGPWASAKSFGRSFRLACRRGKFVHDLKFHDLRGTAVTRLAIAGCTEAEIASITTHAIGRVKSILEIHYLHYNLEIRENAIRKLEAKYAAVPARFPNLRPNLRVLEGSGQRIWQKNQ